MKDDRTWQSYEQTAEQYAKNVEELHPHNEGERFLSLLKGKKAILDLGCGSGRDAKIFSEKGFQVTGIDYSPSLIEIANAKAPNCRFLVGNIQEMILDTAFDGIWANVSLLHIPKSNIVSMLIKIHQHLNENGIFYMKVKKGIGEGLENDSRYDKAPQKFYSYFQEEELSTFLKTAGFTLLNVYTEIKTYSYHTHPYIHTFSIRK